MSIRPLDPNRGTLTVEEAARRLGICRASALLAVKRGDIPAIRIGKRFYVPKAALERLLQTLEASPSKPAA
jgi:excisionase family DNA binding protein